MITFRPLTTAEYDLHTATSTAQYANDLAANFRLPAGIAAAESAHITTQSRLQGPESNTETTWAILSADGRLLGCIGFREAPETGSAYITDFDILPEHRGKGHGTEALAGLEDYLRGKGISQIRLRVAANNLRAKALYETLGFFATGTNMAKDI